MLLRTPSQTGKKEYRERGLIPQTRSTKSKVLTTGGGLPLAGGIYGVSSRGSVHEGAVSQSSSYAGSECEARRGKRLQNS